MKHTSDTLSDTAEKYSTKDFHLACFFIACNHKVKNITTFGDTNQATFIFEDSGKLRILKRQYLLGQALVDPVLYKEAISTLNSVVADYRWIHY